MTPPRTPLARTTAPFHRFSADPKPQPYSVAACFVLAVRAAPPASLAAPPAFLAAYLPGHPAPILSDSRALFPPTATDARSAASSAFPVAGCLLPSQIRTYVVTGGHGRGRLRLLWPSVGVPLRRAQPRLPAFRERRRLRLLCWYARSGPQCPGAISRGGVPSSQRVRQLASRRGCPGRRSARRNL